VGDGMCFLFAMQDRMALST